VGTFELSWETNLRFCSSIQASIRSCAPLSVDSLPAFCRRSIPDPMTATSLRKIKAEVCPNDCNEFTAIFYLLSGLLWRQFQ
jgi:hypothetical protein